MFEVVHQPGPQVPPPGRGRQWPPGRHHGQRDQQLGVDAGQGLGPGGLLLVFPPVVVDRAVEVLNLGRSMWLLGVAGWWVLMPAATLRVAQDSHLTRVEWSR